ncbi:hypothetical protein CHS0354_021707 [Potamilus streckersoni]|uniref:Uncharacterized protein n=1 Tax=Potamilus streckersoni TaxID=2493646 RepID=A0AAE0WGY1_9BIVA|nr:hypothetical protein CHS0354_021707 [Potamilus streckersoni]
MGQELSGPIGHLTNHLTRSTLDLAGSTSAAGVADKVAESTNRERTLMVRDLTKGHLRELLTNTYIMKLAPYIRCRSEIGSPCIASHFCSQEEIEKFQKENDGFPLPSTKEDLEAFDQAAFIYQPVQHLSSSSPEPPASPSIPASSSGTVPSRTDKTREVPVPDLHALRTKLQKIQSFSIPTSPTVHSPCHFPTESHGSSFGGVSESKV